MAFIIFLQLFLILLNAIFACAEIAVISMNDTKLAKMAASGDKRAIRLVKLTNQPARFLATIQVAITLSGFLGSAFAAENFSGILVDWVVSLGVKIPVNVLDSIAVVLITIILSYFTLVFGELVPKQVAMRKAETLALGLSALIYYISKIFKPIVSFLTFSTNSILKLFRIDPNAVEDEVSEEEIRMMVDAGSEKGTIDDDERDFIQNVFEFDDLVAEEIATHRTEVVILDLEDSMEIWRETIYNTRYTRYPVCDGSSDNVVGILNAKEYFRLEDQSRENVMAKAVVDAYFVPDTVKADILFRNMKKEKRQLAVVIDEYGGMTGIITLNDLVEQLVGDLGDDEAEEDGDEIEQTGACTWKVCGCVTLEELSERLQIHLMSEEYDTLNGLIFDVLGTIPQEGEELTIEGVGLHIKVVEIENRQVKTAIVTLES